MREEELKREVDMLKAMLLQVRNELAAEREARERAEAACAEMVEISKAGSELAGFASYAEIVGGISTNRPQIRQWCDAVFKHSKEVDLSTPGTLWDEVKALRELEMAAKDVAEGDFYNGRREKLKSALKAVSEAR